MQFSTEISTYIVILTAAKVHFLILLFSYSMLHSCLCTSARCVRHPRDIINSGAMTTGLVFLVNTVSEAES